MTGPFRGSAYPEVMSVRRVMGTELEYGISVPGQPGANPTTLSSLVVNAWAVAEAPAPRRSPALGRAGPPAPAGRRRRGPVAAA